MPKLVPLVLGTTLAVAVLTAVGVRRSDTEPADGGVAVEAPALPGQTATLLPSGLWLLVGGDVGGTILGTAAIRDPRTGETRAVAAGLRQARAWHTATLLPDGTVLIFGGFGAGQEALSSGEIFNPVTQTFIAVSTGLTPRALHTATLLMDGSVLIAGGLSANGEPLASVELWDARSGSVKTLAGHLGTARYHHTATLLPNGLVFLWDGLDRNGGVLLNGELVDPETEQVTSVGSLVLPFDPGRPELTASIPPDGAADVATPLLIGLRFSKPLRMETVSADTVALTGPEGLVGATIVPAEGGMLTFVTPTTPLQPGATYTVALQGPTDEIGLPLLPTEIRFTTRSQPEGGGALGEPRAQAAEAAGGEEWIPDPSRGGWTTGRPDSPWHALPPLQAPRGVTALAGQVLRLNGEPLAGVSLQMGEHTARTDDTGRFLLTGLTAGHAELMIDGGATHGTFEVGVDVVRGRTTVLPFTIWLPKIDLANAVTIPSPTTAEVVVTSPKIPGLEVHIPPNTVIRDYRGQVVKRVSITAIPVDRPPFPLVEPEKVPLYFTVQPGCSYVWNVKGDGARLIYPNSRQELAGTRFAFWNYDPDERGWYVYGHGSVIPGGAEVVPDPGVSVYEFTGAMVIGSGSGPGSGPGSCGGGCCDPASGAGDGSSGGCGGGGGGDGSYGGEPVSLATGLFVQRNTDLFLPDSIPINLIRTYRQNDGKVRAFGLSTTHPYDIFLEGNTFPYT